MLGGFRCEGGLVEVTLSRPANNPESVTRPMVLPTLLLTRPQHSAQAFADTLDSSALASVQLVIAPLMEIIQINDALSLNGIAGVIFTSANGVAFSPHGMDRPAFCVGAETTKQAIARGWNAQKAGTNAHELIATLQTMQPNAPLLHLGGEHTIGDIAQTLTAGGIETRHVALYRQQLLPLSEEGFAILKGPTIIPIFSARTAQNLMVEAQGNLNSAHIIALSVAVGAPFDGENVAQRIILPSPQAINMRKAVENLCLSLSLP